MSEASLGALLYVSSTNDVCALSKATECTLSIGSFTQSSIWLSAVAELERCADLPEIVVLDLLSLSRHTPLAQDLGCVLSRLRW